MLSTPPKRKERRVRNRGKAVFITKLYTASLVGADASRGEKRQRLTNMSSTDDCAASFATGLEVMSSMLMRRPALGATAALLLGGGLAGSKKGFRGTVLAAVDAGMGSRKGDVGLGIEGDTARPRNGLFDANCEVRSSAGSE